MAHFTIQALESEEEVIPIEPNYFDRRVEEEDEPIQVEDETQNKCRILDVIFEEFFEDDFLYVAKVLYILIKIIAKFKTGTRYKKSK